MNSNKDYAIAMMSCDTLDEAEKEIAKIKEEIIKQAKNDTDNARNAYCILLENTIKIATRYLVEISGTRLSHDCNNIAIKAIKEIEGEI